ncbi:MAG: TerB family tellurite resistance protein [Gemmobacter sp.]
MFARLLDRLMNPAPAPLAGSDARLALAALMVRLARADGHYAPEEVARIDRLLAARYGVSPGEAAKLRGMAEVLEQEAPDTVRFTRALKAAVPLEDRIGLIEALWAVALADGSRDDDEDRLMRLVADLLGLTDRDSALARRRTEGRGGVV